MSVDLLSGKKILVLGGHVDEVIDGVRHYANHARPATHGQQAANLLRRYGAQITLIDKNINGAPIGNTRQFLAIAKSAIEGTAYDAVLNLANVPAIAAARPSEKKLKVKKEAGSLVPMDVIGNADIPGALNDAGKGTPIAGYDQKQQWFATGNTAITAALKHIADNSIEAPQASINLLPGAVKPGSNGSLSGRKIIITSGSTAEPVSNHGDVITNFSSGAQGHAVAEALADMGANVVLIAGLTTIPDPLHPNITTIHTASARTMRDAVLAQLPADVYVGIAAVADFGLEHLAALTLAPGEPATLRLSQNPDILQDVSMHPSLRPPVVIGFAAETHDLLTYARGKLENKGADAICANQVGSLSINSGNENQVTWVTAGGNEPWERMSKREVGQKIGDKIVFLLQRTDAPSPQNSVDGNFGII